MVESKERRSNRSKKPKIHFDEIAQSSRPSKPSTAPKKPSLKLTNPITKPTKKPLPIAKPSKSPINLPILDPVEDFCSQIAKLNIKVKKKVKSDEIARLSKLGFKSILEEIKSLQEVEFELFILGDHRKPKVNISSNIDITDFLILLDFFIPPKMYAIIAENINLYVISKNAPLIRTKSNSRYWWFTNENKIRVLFNILYYIGVYKEPNYRIY